MSPAALRAQAARLRAAGGALPLALRDVAAATGPDVWRGPAANAFDDELARRQKHLEQCRDELEAVAKRLLTIADDIETRERERGANAAAA